MKKLLRRGFALVLVIVLVCSLCISAFAASKKYGDVNNDGAVTGKDVTLIRRYIVGGYDVTLTEKYADIDGDGEITGKDILILRRHLAGGYDVTLPPDEALPDTPPSAENSTPWIPIP